MEGAETIGACPSEDSPVVAAAAVAAADQPLHASGASSVWSDSSGGESSGSDTSSGDGNNVPEEGAPERAGAPASGRVEQPAAGAEERDDDDESSDDDDDDDDESSDDEDGDEEVEELAAASAREEMTRERFGPDGWQVISRSINRWLAAEVLEHSEMDDGTSVLNVRYTLPDGRERQKWVVNEVEEVRRDPAMSRSLSPIHLQTPAEWGIPLSPRSPLTVMESFDQFQGQPEPEPEQEPGPGGMDREVALATAMALQAAEAAASGVNGIPPGLNKKKSKAPEGLPPGSRGIMRVVSGDGGSGPVKVGGKPEKKKGLRGISKKLSQGRRLHVSWAVDGEGSCETAAEELVLTDSERRSRKRHVMWIGEQRMKESEGPASPQMDGLMDGSFDRIDAEGRPMRSGRDMSDIC